MLDTQWILNNGSLNLLLPLLLFSGKSLILNVYKWLCKHLVRSHIVIWFVICQEKKCGHSKYIQPSQAIKYLLYLTFTETDSKFRQDRTNVPAPDAGQTSQEKTNLGIYTSSGCRNYSFMSERIIIRRKQNTPNPPMITL